MLSGKEEAVKFVPSEDAKLALFENSYKKQTQFFTTYSPCAAFTVILEKINDLDGVTDLKISGENWKVQFAYAMPEFEEKPEQEGEAVE